ncbi:hypothetical protein KIPB_013034, partial [Kipferlia bialata]|eukprot:g13034.t1
MSPCADSDTPSSGSIECTDGKALCTDAQARLVPLASLDPSSVSPSAELCDLCTDGVEAVTEVTEGDPESSACVSGGGSGSGSSSACVRGGGALTSSSDLHIWVEEEVDLEDEGEREAEPVYNEPSLVSEPSFDRSIGCPDSSSGVIKLSDSGDLPAGSGLSATLLPLSFTR